MDIPCLEDGIRPAGKPDECFYCHQKIGTQHRDDCVMLERTVVVKMEIEFVHRVPRYFDVESIEFQLNRSSACAINFIEEMVAGAQAAPKNTCNVCSRTSFTYIREATAQDHDDMGFTDLSKTIEATVEANLKLMN